MSSLVDGSKPLYVQLARMLEQEIAAGQFPPYSRLMSESTLMRRFGVSRVTVRAAIMRLVQKGLVDVRQGKGTFVAGPVIRQSIDGFSCVHDVLVAQGFDPDRRLLQYRQATHEERAGSPFAASAVKPVLLQRLYALHGKPVALVHGLLSPRVATGTHREAVATTILEMMRNSGQPVAHADLAIRARPAAGEVGRLLELPRRRTVLVLERTSYDQGGDVLDHSRFHIVPEAWEFAMRVPAVETA